MSEGPIKQMRAAWAPPKSTVTAATRVCAPNLAGGRTACGRRMTSKTKTGDWDQVTCPECHAAARADR